MVDSDRSVKIVVHVLQILIVPQRPHTLLNLEMPPVLRPHLFRYLKVAEEAKLVSSILYPQEDSLPGRQWPCRQSHNAMFLLCHPIEK